MWEAVHSTGQPEGKIPPQVFARSVLTKRSRIRTSSTPQLSDTLHKSSPTSARATGSRKKIRSSGSISRRYTRTPIRASKVVARIGEYLPCPALVLCTRRMPRCKWAPWTGTSLAITSMAVIAAAAAHHFRRMLPAAPILGQIAATTTAHPCIPAIRLREAVTMTWSSRNGRCTDDHSPHAHQIDGNTRPRHKNRASRL